MKQLSFFLLLLVLILALPKTASGQEVPTTTVTQSHSAMLWTPVATTPKKDTRAEVLQAYLLTKNSPLSDNAEDFIREADENDIDWRLLMAISGVESSFGRRIPPYSYNGWGYGIYGTHSRGFTNWNEAITTISKAIKEDYMGRWGAKDVYGIGRIYATDPLWASKVNHYLTDFEDFQSHYQNTSLSISL